jgi:hypothetical protein
MLGPAALLGLSACAMGTVASVRVPQANVAQVAAPPRPPLPAEVRVFLEPVARRHIDIAFIEANSRRSWAFTADGKAEVVLERLKREAARLGANAIVLEDISDSAGDAVGVGIGTDLSGDRGSLGLMFGGFGQLSPRVGRAMAIYLVPDSR